MKRYILIGLGVLSNSISLISLKLTAALMRCLGIVIIDEEEVYYEGYKD